MVFCGTCNNVQRYSEVYFETRISVVVCDVTLSVYSHRTSLKYAWPRWGSNLRPFEY